MSTGVLLLAAVIAIAVWQYGANPKREKARVAFLFGPTPRDYTISALFFVSFFGGLLLALVAMGKYPLLDIRALWVTSAFYVVVFAASFWIVRKRAFPAWASAWMRVSARAGWSLGATALLLGVVLIANAYATPMETRTAQLVRKEMSRERDPSRRQYRFYILAWPGSDTVTEVDASASVYDRAQIGHPVLLTLGRGRLGLEWVHDVNVPAQRQ